MDSKSRSLASSVSLEAALVIAAGAVAAACAPGPTVPADEAAAQIATWLPGADVRVTHSEAEPGGALVQADASGEPVEFRFHNDDSGWSIAGMLHDGETLDWVAGKAAWVEMARTPRPVTLAQMVAGDRPAAPLEVLIEGLRIASVAEERMELESIEDPDIGHVVLIGRHFDNLPLELGEEVAIQVQTLRQEDGDWYPQRQTVDNALMIELEPLDLTLLELLKLRLPDQVVPIPYAIPDMAHEHGE